MSRIAGIVTHKPDQASRIKAMLTAVRGNNKWPIETYSINEGGLGWTGQSGDQIYQESGIAVVLDGHIYNAADFRLGKNYGQIIATLYKKEGFEETIKRLNGDFAIALFDFEKRELLLARDRIAVKPLYFTLQNSVFAFASRIKSLLLLSEVATEVNTAFVGRFAGSHYRYIDNDPDGSPYKDIRQLRAGHILSFRDGQIRTYPYWEIADQADFAGSEYELAVRYRELLLDAVKIRLDAARNPGFTLSGGMDSSSVTACARKMGGAKVDAFSTVYVDKTYDEAEEIQSMLAENVREWHKIVIDTPDIFPVLEKMIAAHDEPVATATWLSHYLLCERTAQNGVGSLFGGLGGDELNAGEYEYFFYYFADLVAAKRDAEFAQEVNKWVEYHDHPIFKKNMQVARDGLRRMVDIQIPGKCLVEDRRMLRYAQSLNTDYIDLWAFEPNMSHPFKSYLKNRTFQDMFYETAPCCLRAEDRQCTAFGLDNFLPFFDHRLVEFMFRIPGDLKIRKGVTKVLLRQAMKGILPEETRTRITKTGWNAPAHQWFMGKGMDKLFDLIRSQKFQQRGIYNVSEVERLAHEHRDIVMNQRLQENHMMFFWQLVNLEIWLQSVESYRKESVEV